MSNPSTIRLHCPKCDCTRNKVVDTRGLEYYILRRRECLDCEERFSTYEVHQSKFNEFVALWNKANGG